MPNKPPIHIHLHLSNHSFSSFTQTIVELSCLTIVNVSTCLSFFIFQLFFNCCYYSFSYFFVFIFIDVIIHDFVTTLFCTLILLQIIYHHDQKIITTRPFVNISLHHYQSLIATFFYSKYSHLPYHLYTLCLSFIISPLLPVFPAYKML